MLISILLSFFSLFYWLSIWMLFVLVIEEQSSEMVLKQVYRVWFRGSPNWIRWPCEHAFLLKQKFTSNKILAVIEEIIRLVPPTGCETRVHRYIEVALDMYFAKTPIWNFVRHHQGPTGSRYPTRPELFLKYPTRPDPKIENDWVLGN